MACFKVISYFSKKAYVDNEKKGFQKSLPTSLLAVFCYLQLLLKKTFFKKKSKDYSCKKFLTGLFKMAQFDE